jgi:SAM-dependent methyltransferase
MKNVATTVDPYQTIAQLYDLEHDDFLDDVELLISFAGAVGGPVLEMGCGSGRVLVPLAEAGFQVVGLDTSPTMLDRASNRAVAADVTGRLTLVQGDMQDATTVPGGPFRIIVFSLNALMHLSTPEAQLDALTNARKAMALGGLLIVDVMNPSPGYLEDLARGSIHEGCWTLEDGTAVDKWAVRDIDSVRQQVETVVWYDNVTPAGHLTRFRSQFTLRYLHPHELALMLRLAGFTTSSAYGSYELDPLFDASERLLVTAQAGDDQTTEHDLDEPLVLIPGED